MGNYTVTEVIIQPHNNNNRTSSCIPYYPEKTKNHKYLRNLNSKMSEWKQVLLVVDTTSC